MHINLKKKKTLTCISDDEEGGKSGLHDQPDEFNLMVKKIMKQRFKENLFMNPRILCL